VLSPKKKSAALSVEGDAAATPKPSFSVQKSSVQTGKTGASNQGRIFLIDAMSFIFRAYHAMARQRGMSTKTGLPTAATYVFVNMLRKLRDDFSHHQRAPL